MRIVPSVEASSEGHGAAARSRVAIAVGIGQIFAFGSTYYLPAVAAPAIVHDTGWALTWVMAAVSLALLVSGLVSPLVARAIGRFGGRAVLSGSALLLGAGLLALGASRTLPAYVASWAFLGVGMGSGLYDACFSTLGRLYGMRARTAITAMTLVGGFASTVCWPLWAYLIAHVGWRGACTAYAAILALMISPLYLVAVPAAAAGVAENPDTTDENEDGAQRRSILALIASTVALAAGITTLLSTSAILLLRSRGLDPAAALVVAALIGPSQVGARVVLLAMRDRLHPAALAVGAAALVAAGMALVALGAGGAAVGIVLYGAGAGIHSITRGMLPLAFTGGGGALATTVGRVALPAFLTQAAAPLIGAALIRAVSPSGTLVVLAAAAAANVAVALILARAFGSSLHGVPSAVEAL
ncbi:MAG: MFS transporter [Candidatus Eremiobacteraeota bacterium]|nr:MFS transporter [Candidatus Eremiobacteraeota bacterium]